MPVMTIPPEAALDLTTANDAWAVYVGRYDMLRVQTSIASGAWGTAVVTLEVSLDGTTWYTWPEQGAITFSSADSLSSAYFLDAIANVRFRVSTADAAAGTLNIYVTASCTGFEEARYGVT